ncbi:F0F1 ATP synthase subunit C [Halolamina sp. CBA1230]|uniref:F0F1 ATP synthase subunit C n=1 Tax=Halolamina sp. CBA1230 TaxID=1853690 RepID=UPI0009A21297|nr:F0F1 ATP synthase subunit C [Halolamina sp. CBA1230]QKY21741.1 F0F1 ATP synthase subunit C [Halolamina sp. CBA1230]
MFETAPQVASLVLQEGSTSPAITGTGMAALAVGLAGLGAGYAERGIGSAAVGAVAEDEDLFVRALILTVLPETILIFALVAMILAA